MILKDLHPLMEYLRQHPHVGEFFAFLVAFSESLPLIGTIVPGTITMTAVGFLIGSGSLPAITALCIVAFGALAGDAIGFIIGFYYNERLRRIWPFSKHPKWLTLGEDFFHKHGGKSIIIGRFVGPVRSTVPLIAGLLQLAWTRFFSAAIPSAILWSIVYTLPGIILGALSKEVPHGEMTKFLLYGVAIIAISWFVFWVIQHFFVQLVRAINNATDRLWRYLSKHNSSHWLIRLITNQQEKNDHHQLTLLMFALVSGLLFLILLINVRFHSILTDWNTPIFHLLQSIHTTQLTNILIIVTLMGAPKTIMLVGVIFSIGLLFKKQWRAGFHMLAAVILTAGATLVFKQLSHSARPEGFYFVAKTSSFPSGHTALSFVITAFIAFLFTGIIKKKNSWIPSLLCGLFISSVAFSRLYLGAHWFTDIIGSCLLALPILFSLMISYHRRPVTNNSNHNVAITSILACIAFGLAWGVLIPENFHPSQKRYTQVWPTTSISKTAWWNEPQKYTPLYRKNRLGKIFQPFNVQWLDTLQHIQKTLKRSSWVTISDKVPFKNQLQRFASYNPEYHMPLLPWLYHNRPPKLFMIKHLPDHKRIVELRLWTSDIQIKNSASPLWLGAADVRLSPKKLLSIKDRARISLEKHAAINQLLVDSKMSQQKIVTTNISTKKLNNLNWNGKILLISN